MEQSIQPANVVTQPKFYTKQQREEMKRKQQEELKNKEEISEMQIRKHRKQFFNRNLQQLQAKQSKRKSKSRSRSRSRSPVKQLGKNSFSTSNTRATVPVKLTGEDKELQSIKMQYLGLNREKKKMLRPSEKFKNIFNFEWDDNQDTSYDTNPLYNNRIEQNLLFGRGMVAGTDYREQKKKSCDYPKLIKRFDNPQEQRQGQVDSDQDKNINKTRDLGINVHWEKKTVEQMTDRDWRIFREDHEIFIKGGRVPQPMREWDANLLPSNLIEAFRHCKYKHPTPIQMQAIPIGMQRKDMIGVAPTGSGKSLAFLAPMIAYLQTLPCLDDYTCKDGPLGLIMTPTRELAIQIDKEFQKLSIGTKMRSTIVVGGRKAEEQAFFLRSGSEILIGTPGRIKDILESKYVVFNQCQWVILDEADKMIDLGFEEDVNTIMDSIQTRLKDSDENVAELQEKISKSGEGVFRTTHLFSATMPNTVEKLAKKYLRAFCYISIGEPGGGKKDIDQRVEMLPEGAKKMRLQQILRSQQPPIIVFVNQKNAVDIISKVIETWGFKCVSYHGGKTQEQREQAVESFKNKKYDILVTTDLGGRGLDVTGVTLVVNFDAPKTIQDFIHRTGRTGRAGMKGIAITFLTAKDEELFYDVKEFLVKNNYEVPAELENHPASRIKPGSLGDQQPRRKQILFAQ